MTSEIKSNVLRAGEVRGRARGTEQPLAQPHPCPLLLRSCDTGGRGKALDKESGRTGSSPGCRNSVTCASRSPSWGLMSTGRRLDWLENLWYFLLGHPGYCPDSNVSHWGSEGDPFWSLGGIVGSLKRWTSKWKLSRRGGSHPLVSPLWLSDIQTWGLRVSKNRYLVWRGWEQNIYENMHDHLAVPTAREIMKPGTNEGSPFKSLGHFYQLLLREWVLISFFPSPYIPTRALTL